MRLLAFITCALALPTWAQWLPEPGTHPPYVSTPGDITAGGDLTAGNVQVRGNLGVDGGTVLVGDIYASGFGNFSDISAFTATATAQDWYALTSAGGLDVAGGGRFACLPGRIQVGKACLEVLGDGTVDLLRVGELDAGTVWTPFIGNPSGGPLVVSASSLQTALLDAGVVLATAANIGTLDAGTARFGTASAASFVNRGEYGFSYPTPSVLLPCGHADAGFGTIIRWQGAYGGEDWQCTEGSYLACPGCWGPPHNAVNTFAAYGPRDVGAGNSSGVIFRSTDPGTHPSVVGSVRVKIVRTGSCGGSCSANIARGRIYQWNKADGGQRDLVTFAMPCNVAVGQCAQYSNIYPGGQPASSGCTIPITVLTHALTFEEGGAVDFEFQPDGGAAQQCTDNPEPSIFGYTYRFMFPDAGGG